LQEGSSQNLARHVEEEARDLGGESFTRFMDNLYEKIHALAESSDVSDNLAAVRAIDQLIDVQLGEIATKIAKFANCLRWIFDHKKDSEVLINASRALGHLAATGGALTADVVEYQVNFCCPVVLQCACLERTEMCIRRVEPRLHLHVSLLHFWKRVS
jgi:FKBP12-rapamycin complex-associated protein